MTKGTSERRSFNSRLLNFEIQLNMALGAGFSPHSFYFYFKSTLLVISSSMMLIYVLWNRRIKAMKNDRLDTRRKLSNDNSDNG